MLPFVPTVTSLRRRPLICSRTCTRLLGPRSHPRPIRRGTSGTATAAAAGSAEVQPRLSIGSWSVERQTRVVGLHRAAGSSSRVHLAVLGLDLVHLLVLVLMLLVLVHLLRVRVLVVTVDGTAVLAVRSAAVSAMSTVAVSVSIQMRALTTVPVLRPHVVTRPAKRPALLPVHFRQ